MYLIPGADYTIQNTGAVNRRDNCRDVKDPFSGVEKESEQLP